MCPCKIIIHFLPMCGSPYLSLQTASKIVVRDTENADIPIMAPGFGSDFVELIEQNRRRSIATSRILRLRHGEIWPEDGMLKRDIGVFRVPKAPFCNFPANIVKSFEIKTE